MSHDPTEHVCPQCNLIGHTTYLFCLQSQERNSGDSKSFKNIKHFQKYLQVNIFVHITDTFNSTLAVWLLTSTTLL